MVKSLIDMVSILILSILVGALGLKLIDHYTPNELHSSLGYLVGMLVFFMQHHLMKTIKSQDERIDDLLLELRYRLIKKHDDRWLEETKNEVEKAYKKSPWRK